MLVIISDLHLTDGTSGTTVGAQAFKIFREKIRDLAYEASWRKGGAYKPIERLDILLLGDVLDIIRSSKWLDHETGIRPWDSYEDSTYADLVEVISDAILKHNERSLDVLRSLTQENIVTLPPATADGKPGKVGHHYQSEDRVPVEVGLYYLVGNHDWFYHLPGERYDAIRKKVIEAMGLTQEPNQPFPHDPSELEVLLDIYGEHKVFARHGDIYDPFNFEKEHGRNASSLGDAIVVELLNKFPDQVEKQFQGRLSNFIIDNIKEIDNVRPLPMIPVWIDKLLDNHGVQKDIRKEIKEVWNGLASNFLDLEFVKSRDKPWRLDIVDSMQLALQMSELISFDTISKLINMVYGNKDAIESYKKFATEEEVLLTKQANHLVYGHTHYPEIVPMDVYTNAQGAVSEQIYFNSGTWRQIFRKTYASDGIKFIGYKVMNILSFYKEDERQGRTFEVWNGALN